MKKTIQQIAEWPFYARASITPLPAYHAGKARCYLAEAG
jgi:hypothetical protein